MKTISALICAVLFCAGLRGNPPEEFWSFPGRQVRLDGIPDWGKKGFALEVYLQSDSDNCGYALLMPRSFGFPCFRSDGQVRTLLVNTPGRQWMPRNRAKAEHGRWMHYVLTGTPERVSVWRNGNPDLYAGVNGVPVYEQASLLLGESLGWSGENFKGKIALVRIYNRFMGRQEAKRHCRLLEENKSLPEEKGMIFEAVPRPGHQENSKMTTVELDNTLHDVAAYPRSRHLKGRTEEAGAQFPFEDLTGWKLRYPKGMVNVRFTRSREEPLWGNYVGRLEWRHGSVKWRPDAEIQLIPPEDFRIHGDFDAVNIWAFGTAWEKGVRPQLTMAFRIVDAQGNEKCFPIRSMDQGWLHWSGWSIWHKTLPEKVKTPARLKAIIFTGWNETEKIVYLDSLRFYSRSRKSLPDARVPSWKDLGLPTREETILPTPVRPSGSSLRKTGKNSWEFRSERLSFTVVPESGTLSDITASIRGRTFHPAWQGGFCWADGAKLIPPGSNRVKAVSAGAKRDGNSLILDWIYHVNGREQPARWILQLKNNSLILDLSTENGAAAQVKTGGIHGLSGSVIEVPYLVIRGWRHRSEGPGIFCGDGIYVSSFLDWYVSNASELFSESSSRSGGQWVFNRSLGDMTWVPDTVKHTESEDNALFLVNGGAVYQRKSDGQRNPVRERIFLTVDEQFDAVLPNIPNPPHSRLRETAETVWATRMAYEKVPRRDFFKRELAMWRELHAYGAEKINVRYHGDMYRVYVPRRNGDPITFIPDIEPLIGGDEGLRQLFRGLASIGFRAGLYTDHTLLSPLSRDAWDEDFLTQNSAGDWVYGSGGHLQVKNSRMRSLQKRFNRIFKEKFQPSCGYLDQITCPPPWRYTDYDARVPGAGMFSAAYRSFVESLRMEIDDFGPILSEGTSHWLFAGICDSYAQPQRASIHLLPNFQLRKLHLLSNDCGYHLSLLNYLGSGLKPEENIHKLLAFEYAYGNIGHLYGAYHGSPFPRVPDYMIKSYFMIQPMQRFYALTPAERILYRSGEELVPVEEAIRRGTLNNNQIKTIYANGAECAVNLHGKENFPVKLHGKEFLLPPSGFAFFLPGKGMSCSVLLDGRRVDLTRAEGFLYTDHSGIRRRSEFLTASEAYIVRREGSSLKIIPAPFRKPETIRLNLEAFPWLSEGKEIVSAMHDVHGNLLKEKKIPVRGETDLAITGAFFSLTLGLPASGTKSHPTSTSNEGSRK